MVVTRRAPAAPPSRTASSQAVPRATATRQRKEAQSPPNLRSSDMNGDVDDAISKKYRREKPKKKGKKKKGASLADVLGRWLLLFFTIYTLSVCPSDTRLQSPVCRGLAEYRRLVLEPYILPAFHTVLAHPSVAPLVEKAQPYTDRAVVLAHRAEKEFQTRVVPVWNNQVYPRIVEHIAPQYERHIAPQLHKAQVVLGPYLLQAQEKYAQHVEPLAKKAFEGIVRAEEAAAPYVILAAHKTQDGYIRAQPFLAAAWTHIQRLLIRVLAILQVQRRQFVDPHIAKIWARVKELSKGGPVPPPKDDTVRAPRPKVKETPKVVAPPVDGQQVVFQKAEPVVEAPVETPSATPVAEDTSSTASAPVSKSPKASPDTSLISESATHTQDTTSSLVAETPSAEPTVEPASSSTIVATETAAGAAPTSSALSTVETVSPSATIASVAPAATETTDPVLSAASVASSSASIAASSSTAKIVKAADQIDLDAFYAELGLTEDDVPPAADATLEQEPAAPTLTPEEQAALEEQQRQKTAEKRADILARHSKWEEKLDALVRDRKKALRKALVTMRKTAAASLKSDEGIKTQIDGLVKEAERFLAGAEAYLKNLRKETRKDEEKAGLWDRVLAKVDGKFSERLTETEEVVNGWYGKYLINEEQEVTQASNEVKDVADQAQADVGLDYVWLEDVTYWDWQRYHDLIRRSENFTTDAQAIQNGTHPSPPINPILTVLEELETEVQDIVMGFETRLRQLRRVGARAFGRMTPDNEDEEEAEEGIDAEEERLLRDPDVVSILPIPDDEPHPNAAPAVDVPIVGRSKEEVEEAFARAEATLSPEDRIAAALNVTAEAEAEAGAKPVHVEL